LQEARDGVAERVNNQVSWDGLLLPAPIVLSRSGSSAVSVEETLDQPDSALDAYYPGARRIAAYESRVPDESNVAEFTYESLVFGICLASAFFKGVVMGDEQVVVLSQDGLIQ